MKQYLELCKHALANPDSEVLRECCVLVTPTIPNPSPLIVIAGYALVSCAEQQIEYF